ncbi:MAG: type II toxin-antitoxin system VapC family toxin [Firmicutes bacterium]|nr:type II toxin-antitoxin system VapC family toxin [Bacillota bacterium]
MNLLLDTHVLLWTLIDDAKLSEKARAMIDDFENVIFYSTAALWEVQIKYELHPEALEIDAELLRDLLEDAGFGELPIRGAHTIALGTLKKREGTPPHRDPFDRLMIAQAKSEKMRLLTADGKMQYYDEECIEPV